MATVQLEMDEWQRVLAMMALAPWAQANPLLMKIGEQLRTQGAQHGGGHAVDGQENHRGNSGAHRPS